MKEIFRSLVTFAFKKKIYKDSFTETRTSRNIAVKRERTNPLSTKFFSYKMQIHMHEKTTVTLRF